MDGPAAVKIKSRESRCHALSIAAITRPRAKEELSEARLVVEVAACVLPSRISGRPSLKPAAARTGVVREAQTLPETDSRVKSLGASENSLAKSFKGESGR